ncbi:unnamed protein product [Symbiodinium sp. CCMP2592]|nr:unnamed protein product [Symbiodinium sp. CCMP2592]
MEFVKQLFDTFARDPEPLHLGCLRNKNDTNPDLSDVELFGALPTGDLWEDANLPSVYFYLRRNRYLVIPPSWAAQIELFDKELDAKAAEANLQELQQQLSQTAPEPIPAAQPGAPAFATASGNFEAGNAKKSLGRSHTEQMLRASSKFGLSEPTEIATTPRKHSPSETVNIEDSPAGKQLFASNRRSPKSKPTAKAAPKPEGYWKLLVETVVRRHFMPNAKGEVKVTPRVLEMGEQLRKLLLEHGSFDKIEGVLERWHIQKKQSQENGGTVTKQWLIDVRKYSSTMADNAFDWARRHGRVYKSEIHGEEEADIPLEMLWSKTKETGNKTSFNSAFSMEDPDGALLDEKNEDLGKSSISAAQKPSDSVATAQAGASFKMCFPSLQQNSSPLTLLSSYICVLGKKIDLAEKEKDKLSAKTAGGKPMGKASELCKNLDCCLTDMNTCYKELTDVQASPATTCDDQEDGLVDELLTGDWVWLRKAYCLITGFSSNRVCHFCEQEDWYNSTSTSDIRQWTRDVIDEAEDPWKDELSPLRNIPGAEDPWRVRTDPVHTFHIQGVGSSTATSAIVLLSRLQLFAGRSTQDRLDAMYDNFIAWCSKAGKSTSLDGFSLLKFKMKTPLT